MCAGEGETLFTPTRVVSGRILHVCIISLLLSLSLWHRSVSAGRCVSMGPACRSHPTEKQAVPPFPEFFVAGLHCLPPLVYSIVRLIVSLCSFSHRGRPERERSREETEGEGMRKRRKGAESIVSFARHSPAFPSVSLSSFLFLWDSARISNSTGAAPNRGSHGREI